MIDPREAFLVLVLVVLLVLQIPPNNRGRGRRRARPDNLTRFFDPTHFAPRREILLGHSTRLGDSRFVSSLLERLAQELERPRAVSEQVVKHLTGTYEIRREDVGAFLVNELPKLEEYEVDLTLAPLFTPTLNDQALFAGLLGDQSLSPAQWPALIQQLVARPTVTQLVTSDGQTHRVNLCEVTIARFVQRLRLDGAVSSDVAAIVAAAPKADQPMLQAIARRAVWENAARRDILVRFLNAALSAPAGLVADATELLKLAETYQPANLGELLVRIPHWQNMLREEINSAAGAKPFFNERVEELHGGGRDQRRQDNSRLAAKQAEFEFLQRLQVLLGAEPG